jgi:hypothetical protein
VLILLYPLSDEVGPRQRTQRVIEEFEIILQKLKVDRNSRKVEMVINGFINFIPVYKSNPSL